MRVVTGSSYVRRWIMVPFCALAMGGVDQAWCFTASSTHFPPPYKARTNSAQPIALTIRSPLDFNKRTRANHGLPDLRLQLNPNDCELEDVQTGQIRKTQHAKTSQSALRDLKSNPMLARVTVLGVAAMYGTNFGSVKILESNLPPSLAAAMRFSLAGLALLPMLSSARKEVVVPAIEVGLLVSAGYFAQSLGLKTADASTAAFLCSLAAVVCPILEVLEGKTLSATSWASAALAVAGAAVLELGGSAPGVGDLWSLVQPVAFGLAFWKTDHAMKRLPDQVLPLTAIQILVVAASSVLWALVDSGGAVDVGLVREALADPRIVEALAWTGLFTTALTVVLETWALGVLSSAEISVLFATEPLWGTAFAHSVLGEQVGANAVAGGALILGACAFSFAAASDDDDEEESKEGGGEGVGAGLRVAAAGSLSWAMVQLQVLQAELGNVIADLSDIA